MGKNSGEHSFAPDLIRALAIVLVIVYHVAPSFAVNLQDPGPWWVVNISRAISAPCVPLFVMLSGALLLDPSKVNEPLRAFFRKRLNRIGLPLFFWGAVYLAWRRFANHEVLTFNTIWGSFVGAGQFPSSHFWYLYMLIGLYLVTPALRVVVAQLRSRTLGYYIMLWFLGTGILPLLGFFAPTWLPDAVTLGYLFVIPGWVGYFVLGEYLRTKRSRSWILYLILSLGFLLTAVGNWYLTVAAGATGYVGTAFGDVLSANVILATAALFLLLWSVPGDRLERSFSHASGLVRRVSRDSFAVYLLHIMVLEVLVEKGLFGFKLGIINMNPILGIPLLSLCILIVSLGIIWLLRKVPMLNKAIG
jgi:surface polysaccharide O-acyltransferase-like enzyme